MHFEYEKSGLHRVVYADGMYGGVAPRGNHLNISFFSERWPIPKQLDFTPTSAGQNWAKVEGEPKAKKAREGIFREVEVTVVMDLQVAQSFYRWLGEKISLLTTSQGEVERIESNAKEEEHEQ